MNKNIRYPLMLLVSVVGIAWVNYASASSIKPSRYYQPTYFPVSAAYNLERVTSRYRFRPISRHRVNSPYRQPAARYFGGYRGTVVAPPYAYSPQIQPARAYAPRFAGRNSWESAEYTFPRSGYFRPNYFRYPAIHPQVWRGPSASTIANYSFIQRGYQQPRMPAEFAVAWAGGRPGYFGRFRPLPARRPAPAEVAAAWGWQPPAYQRPFRQPHFAPVFRPRAQWNPMGLAYSAPVFKGARKIADNQRYPLPRTNRFAPIDKQSAARNQTHSADGTVRQRGIITAPRFVTSRPVPNSGFAWGDFRQYRFRPDNRMVNRQESAEAMDSESPHPDGIYDRLAPSASSSGYRFRPDNRFSRNFPTAHRLLRPVIATSSEPEFSGQIAASLSEFSATGLCSGSCDNTDSAETVDLYEDSVPDPLRCMRIFGIKSIEDNPTS